MTRYKRRKEKNLPAFSSHTPTDDEIVLWRARDAYGSTCGVLITEPGDLDAPVAFIFADQEKQDADMMLMARQFNDNPGLLDRAVDSTGGFCRMDLRDRGRAGSNRAMPGWCYSLLLTADYERSIGDEEIEWNPYCPIRLQQMLAKKATA